MGSLVESVITSAGGAVGGVFISSVRGAIAGAAEINAASRRTTVQDVKDAARARDELSLVVGTVTHGAVIGNVRAALASDVPALHAVAETAQRCGGGSRVRERGCRYRRDRGGGERH